MTPSIPPALRQAYRTEQTERTYLNVRLYCVLCFLINQAFKILDYVAFHEHFRLFLLARLGLDVVLVLSFFVVTRRNSLLLKRICLISTGLTLTAVVNGTGNYANDYYVGFLLLMFGMNILFPVTATEAFRLSSIFYLTYLIPGLLGLGIEGMVVDFGIHNAFLLSGIAITTVSGKLGERIRVLEFLGRQELRSAYEQLKELSEAKTRFFSNVSHELRTPLTLLLAPLESMRSGDLGELNENQRRYVASMYSNGLRLLRQINHLLDVVKIDADHSVVHREKIDVGMFLENLARTTQPTSVRKRLSLRAMVEKDLPLIAVDPEKFEKVVLNLLSNAVKFTPGGGSILLAAQREGDSVRIRVSDSGIGIAPEFIPQLFERFSQADGSSQRRFGGTGLGLTLVKEFTEAHGGRVEVESTQGEGSSFSVIFPIGHPDTPLAPPDHSEVGDATRSTVDLEMSDSVDEEAADPGETQGVPEGMQDAPLLLVADDNADMCRFMTDALRAEYRVVTAADGIRALRIAKERKPDLLILDIMMPGIDGIELVRRLREDSATSRIPVIMVTARVGLDQKIEGMKVGANDYMYKPFSVAELRARIAGLLRQGRMEREIGARNDELAAKNLRLEDLVIHQEKLSALGELLAGTAHELATPITYMASNTRTLEGYVRDLETYVKASRASGQGEEDALERLARKLDLDGIFEDLEDLVCGFLEGGKRASELLRNLRTYSRRDEQVLRETDLRACISSSLHLLTGHTRGRIRVHRDDDPDLPPVRCMEGQVKQVIVNLVSNVIQAIEGEGDLWISTRHHPGGTDSLEVPCVKILLRDSGKEPLHLQGEIFRPFVTTKEEVRGSGLGLPITRDIVDRHGGRILFESQPGAGTTFVVFLPLPPPSGQPEEPL